MYTRCPHCTTIFRITAEQLRLTHGEVPCVTCARPFNALDSLSDDVTTLILPPVPPATELEAAGDADADPVAETGAETDTDKSIDEAWVKTDVRIEEPLPDPEVRPAPEPEADDVPDDDTGAQTGLYAEDLCDVESTFNTDDTPESGGDEPDQVMDEATGDPVDDHRNSGPTEAGGIEPASPFYTGDSAPGEDEPVDEALEFDAPEQTWTSFFLTSDAIASLEQAGPTPGIEDKSGNVASAQEFVDEDGVQPWISDVDTGSFEFQTADQNEWQRILAELDGETPMPEAGDEDRVAAGETEPNEAWPAEPDSSQDPAPSPDDPFTDDWAATESPDETDPPVILPWLDDEAPGETLERGRDLRASMRILIACAALALLLALQLIHYNRDALAASPTYGAAIRSIYGFAGASLYPDWPLDAFEVTGTEAIAGREHHNALDVLANVVVLGRQPVGLPMIRIVLRDRWTNPVASRVFKPDEYLPVFDPAHPLVDPGTVLPVGISVEDPGAEALGYVVDVCLPRRKTGLECQIGRNPFQ